MRTLNKEEFVEFINFAKKRCEAVDSVASQLKRLLDIDICFLDCQYKHNFLKLLKTVMEDESDWISYFAYDLEWGREYHQGDIVDENGNEIKLQTAEDLYDLLTEGK